MIKSGSFSCFTKWLHEFPMKIVFFFVLNPKRKLDSKFEFESETLSIVWILVHSFVLFPSLRGLNAVSILYTILFMISSNVHIFSSLNSTINLITFSNDHSTSAPLSSIQLLTYEIGNINSGHLLFLSFLFWTMNPNKSLNHDQK